VDYESLTVAELKDILKEGGLPVSGKKSELIRRISKNQAHLNLIASYEKVTVAELEDYLREADLPVSGKRFELIQRVSEHRSNQSRENIVLLVFWSVIVIGVIFATLLFSFFWMIFDEMGGLQEQSFGYYLTRSFLFVLFTTTFFLLPWRVKIFGPW
tara:strand:- start:159 stop:629 length:471 start_codon:yes stop_codon:yes gene_type:complete